MPYGVTHLLVPLILVSLFREFYLKRNPKKPFPLHYALIAGLGGVLPDIDIAISLFLSVLGSQDWWIHRTFTHTIFFPLCFLALAGLALPLHKHLKICHKKHTLFLTVIFLMLALGITIHLILDGLAGNSLYLFYPFSDYDYGLNLLFGYFPEAWHFILFPLIDGIILVFWIVYLEVKHKISDFI